MVILGAVMKPLGPWSVKGVDDDARELARIAAAAAGLTLGAWIDRAIKKSTGLEPATPNFVPITTSRTTFSEESLARSGEIEDMEDSATPVAVESFGDEGENLEASACASLAARESAGAQGEARGVTGLATLAASESPSARGEGMNGTDLDTFGLYDPRFPTGNDETPDSAVDALALLSTVVESAGGLVGAEVGVGSAGVAEAEGLRLGIAVVEGTKNHICVPE